MLSCCAALVPLPGLCDAWCDVVETLIAGRPTSHAPLQRTHALQPSFSFNVFLPLLLTHGIAYALPWPQVSGMGAGQLPPGADRVPGLTWRPVSSVADVLSVLAEGTRSRATASTALNAHSSR